MLSRALKEHQTSQAGRKEEQESRKRDAITSVNTFSNVLLDSLNNDVEKAYNNQRTLEAEAKRLHTQTQRFAKQTAGWVTMIEGFDQALKELGDVENWAKVIEADMTTVASALEYAYKGDGPS